MFQLKLKIKITFVSMKLRFFKIKPVQMKYYELPRLNEKNLKRINNNYFTGYKC